MTPESAHSPALPALLVRTPDAERSLPAGRTYYVGRDPQSDIVVNDSRVSWRHAILRQDGPTWLFEDIGSTNGSFQGRSRVRRVPITGACAVRLGHPDDGPAVSFSVAGPHGGGAPPGGPPPTRFAGVPGASPAAPHVSPAAMPGGAARPPAHPAVPRLPADGGGAAPGGGHRDRAVPAPRLSMERMPSAVMRLPQTVLRIGRATDNQVVVSDLSVSRYHAELRRDPRGGYVIVDLNSHNGTFVNGQRVVSAPVTEADVIAIGPATFRLVGEELQEFLDTGDISFIANDLTVTLPSGRVLLDHVSFPLGERCLMGVIGPSGAGKSPLLGALTGINPANGGTVLYDGRDLYTHYAELRHRIGLVPQENILHTQLAARRALGYAAELRFPRDTSKAERDQRITEVLAELALTSHAGTKVAAMSGGQQKRVNVALELLTKPSLLFLDEPTSGLDPGLDKSVMELCADLAHDGRTVIVVTHSVLHLDVCDRLLVLVPGGKIAYFGAPRDGLKYFGKPGWAEVFQAFDAEPNRDWAGEYRRSPYFQQYVVAGMAGAAAVGARPPRPAQAAAPRPSNRLAQTSTLIRRYTAVIASDRGLLALLVGSVIALGALAQFFPLRRFDGGPPPALKPNVNATPELLILILCASFAGALNSVRELVKERPIFARERAAGLSTGAYLASKLVVLGVISGLQALLLVAIGLAGKMFPAPALVLPNPLLAIAVTTALVAVVSMVIGLLISSAVSKSEQAMPLVFVIVMLQVVTTGGLLAVNKPGLAQLAWLTPSRWGFAAAAATVNLNYISGGPQARVADALWNHTAHNWLLCVAAMAGLFVLYSLLTWWRLARLGPLKRG